MNNIQDVDLPPFCESCFCYHKADCPCPDLSSRQYEELIQKLAEPGDDPIFIDDDKRVEGICSLCHHSLENNPHGFDQNDAHIDKTGKMTHSGQCTYCKECRLNPSPINH